MPGQPKAITVAQNRPAARLAAALPDIQGHISHWHEYLNVVGCNVLWVVHVLDGLEPVMGGYLGREELGGCLDMLRASALVCLSVDVNDKQIEERQQDLCNTSGVASLVIALMRTGADPDQSCLSL